MAFPDLVDILARVRNDLNESTAAMWSDAELYTMINDGERDIAIKTGCIENTDTAVTVANTRTVGFTGYDVKAVEYVPASGAPVALQRITLQNLGRVKVEGIIPQYFAVWGNYILIEPKPTKVYNLNVTVMDYPAAILDESTDEPEIQKEYHDDIIAYTLYNALIKPGKFRQSQDYYKRYAESLLRKLNMLSTRKPEPEYIYLVPDNIDRKQPQPDEGGGK